jgi:hypothetical protein
MIFNIVHPFMLPIHAVSLNEGIKDFVKIHRFLEINDMIVQDRDKIFKANMKYLKNDTRNKVGIDIVPYSGPIIQAPTYQNFVHTYFPMYTYFQNGGSVGFGVRTSLPPQPRRVTIVPNYGIHPTLGTPIYRIHDIRPEKPEFKGANFESFKNNSGSIETSSEDLVKMFEKYIKDKRTKEEDEEINEQKKKVDDLKKEIDKFKGTEEEKEKKKEQLKDENRILDNLESNFKTSQLTEFLKNVDNEKNSSITKDFIDHYHHLSSLPSSMPVTHNHDNLPIHTHKNLQSVTPTLSVPGTILRFIRR